MKQIITATKKTLIYFNFNKDKLMKLLGTLDELINLEFNRLTKLSNMSASTIWKRLRLGKTQRFKILTLTLIGDTYMRCLAKHSISQRQTVQNTGICS